MFFRILVIPIKFCGFNGVVLLLLEAVFHLMNSEILPFSNSVPSYSVKLVYQFSRLPYIPTITNHTQLWWVPNVVVAHQKEGIEALHLASGRTVCKLHLQEGGLHADINGDGVLDHVQVIGRNGAEQTVVSGSMEVLRPCWAVATSGVPVREQLFNASICHHSPFNLFQHSDFSRSFGRDADSGSLEVATPILIQTNDGHRHRKGSHGDVVFLTNRGEVTSYSPSLHGHDAIWRWQLLTGATWSNLPSPAGMMDAGLVVPTLKPFSLRVYDTQELILAAGDQEAIVISPGGSQLASFDLPAPPTHALICQDFSNDGLTDIILVTSNGIYGFVQTRQPGALFFSTLLGCLIIVMGVIFISQHLNSVKGKPRASTDYR
ncbi:Fg-gap repeat-containing protein [Thalictrum thalictroides]|uniref:Fg-gap repeat-containing protein n=1 Tax=Thalictrum thalictroides TaxID=46969 RepID=A0A7J6UXJ2_THATH|nr:Fg-gap repeat-containing protein [Thalictrum thalictroides]